MIEIKQTNRGYAIRLVVLFAFLIMSVVLFAVNFQFTTVQERSERNYLTHVGELATLYQEMVRFALLAAAGEPGQVDRLEVAHLEFEAHVEHLRTGKHGGHGAEEGAPHGEAAPVTRTGQADDHGGKAEGHGEQAGGHGEEKPGQMQQMAQAGAGDGHGAEKAGDGHGEKGAAHDAEHDAIAAKHAESLSDFERFPEIPPVPPRIAEMLNNIDQLWLRVKPSVHQITDRRADLRSLLDDGDFLLKELPRLQAKSDEVATEIVAARRDSRQAYLAGRMTLFLDRVQRNVVDLTRGRASAVAAVDELARNVALMASTLEALRDGNRALGVGRISDQTTQVRLRELEGLWQSHLPRIGRIQVAGTAGYDTRIAANGLNDLETGMMEGIRRVEEGVRQLADDSIFSLETGYLLGGIVLAIVMLISLTIVLRTRSQQAESDRLRSETEQINRRTQAAILTLLDEMSTLADGDLTVTATVTEEITGAIADSVNYAIAALRDLVATINTTSEEVSRAAQRTRSTAINLAEASDHQAQQITSATTAINKMAASIEEVSRDAQESATVAKRSVEIAHKGSDTVQRTIHGMDAIREQIQETSKRIKRLGESSQEIGAIVGLINDIADQTNILALNAAIQAAMAGEAGRGFAVVADEVQRLAERSTDATKQIEALIKTIQTDTNEAVHSMEQSTSGVVAGAKLAEDAGVALTEIETVSGRLAEQVTTISQSAVRQSRAATEVSNTMNVILDITKQVSVGTSETAESIGNLTELANELHESVAGFKLPGEELLEVAEESIPELGAEAVVDAAPQRVVKLAGEAEEEFDLMAELRDLRSEAQSGEEFSIDEDGDLSAAVLEELAAELDASGEDLDMDLGKEAGTGTGRK